MEQLIPLFAVMFDITAGPAGVNGVACAIYLLLVGLPIYGYIERKYLTKK